MENLKSGFKTIIITLAITFSLTGCTQIINVLDFIGVIPPWEHKLEFQLGKQAIEEPFTFADYCKEEYDRIFIVQPYFDTEKAVFANLNMSNGLKSLCNINTVSETISTILFIKDNKVQAYTIAEREIADFVTTELEKHYIFPINQKFIMDKERKIHIYDK
jgi:hypothetical protein